MHTCWAEQPQLLPHYNAHRQRTALRICAESLPAAIFTSCYGSNNTLPICGGYIYWGQMKVVFLRSQRRWHVGMLLLFCFQSKVSSWWMCFPALCSPRAFHSSHRQLHSICLGGGTITAREGEFLGADVCVCDTECVYTCTSVYTWFLPLTLWLMLTVLP